MATKTFEEYRLSESFIENTAPGNSWGLASFTAGLAVLYLAAVGDGDCHGCTDTECRYACEDWFTHPKRRSADKKMDSYGGKGDAALRLACRNVLKVCYNSSPAKLEENLLKLKESAKQALAKKK